MDSDEQISAMIEQLEALLTKHEWPALMPLLALLLDGRVSIAELDALLGRLQANLRSMPRDQWPAEFRNAVLADCDVREASALAGCGGTVEAARTISRLAARARRDPAARAALEALHESTRKALATLDEAE